MSDPRTATRREALVAQERSLRREIDELGADPNLDEVAFDAELEAEFARIEIPRKLNVSGGPKSP